MKSLKQGMGEREGCKDKKRYITFINVYLIERNDYMSPRVPIDIRIILICSFRDILLLTD